MGVAKKGTADTSGSEATPEPDGAQVQGKGRPTPTRKQAQAARAQPLVGSRDKAATKLQRQQQAEARERARAGMMRGDERYLTVRDRGPQRRYVRDYVDARFNIGEMLIPMMLIVLIMTFIPGTIQVISIFIVWGFLGLAIIDAILLGMRLQKQLAVRFGESKVQKGFRWYAAMRSFQFRMLRMPKPRVRRREFPA